MFSSLNSSISILIFMFTLLFSSCGGKNQNEPEEPDNVEAKHFTLIYAVNRSSLRSDFRADSLEMMQAL